MKNTIAGAERLARQLLADQPTRLRHVEGVVRHMEDWLHYVGETGKVYELHMQIAWLHDIGYSESLNKEGFHAVDGYRYLKEQGWDYPVYIGVLLHSYSHELAQHLKPQLVNLYDTQELLDYIARYPNFFTYITLVDLHTSPTGEFVTFEARRADVYERYGAHPIAWHIYEIEDSLRDMAFEVDFHKFARENLANAQ